MSHARPATSAGPCGLGDARHRRSGTALSGGGALRRARAARASERVGPARERGARGRSRLARADADVRARRGPTLRDFGFRQPRAAAEPEPHTETLAHAHRQRTHEQHTRARSGAPARKSCTRRRRLVGTGARRSSARSGPGCCHRPLAPVDLARRLEDCGLLLLAAPQEIDLLGRGREVVRQFVRRRVPSQFGLERARRLSQRRELVVDVSREADHPALLGQRPQRRLADPERRVGREPEILAPGRSADGARQPEGALLRAGPRGPSRRTGSASRCSRRGAGSPGSKSRGPPRRAASRRSGTQSPHPTSGPTRSPI